MISRIRCIKGFGFFSLINPLINPLMKIVGSCFTFPDISNVVTTIDIEFTYVINEKCPKLEK